MPKDLPVLLGLDVSFDSFNANLYGHSSQDLYWHSDDEDMLRLSELQRDTFKVSVSFGASRMFSVRKEYTSQEVPIELRDGDVLSMEGLFQDRFDHIVTK